jgi:multicomponent Na+:H+ antiporter subunit G
MLRMPDFYTRLHAAGVVDTLGAGLIVFGLALQAGLSLAAAKLIVVALLILFTSPTATHALAQAALGRGLEPLIAQEKDAPSKP